MVAVTPPTDGELLGAQVELQCPRAASRGGVARRCGVLDPVSFGARFCQRVETGEDEFGGGLDGHLRGSVDPLVHYPAALLVPVVDVLPPAVGIVVGADPFAELGQLERVELLCIMHQVGLDLLTVLGLHRIRQLLDRLDHDAGVPLADGSVGPRGGQGGEHRRRRLTGGQRPAGTGGVRP